MIILCLVALALGNPTAQDDLRLDDMETKMIRKMDELKKTHSIRVFGDIVTLEKLDDSEVEQRAIQGEDPLLASVDNFFNSRKIHIQLPSDGSSADFLGRALGQKNIDIELKSLTHGASEGKTL